MRFSVWFFFQVTKLMTHHPLKRVVHRGLFFSDDDMMNFPQKCRRVGPAYTLREHFMRNAADPGGQG